MFKYIKYIKNKKAQILLPAVLLVPTILLVIYLLFETTKLSIFKIRDQFALDTGAFAHFTHTTSFLNATAYFNGAFPTRLFRENLGEKEVGKETDENGNEIEGPTTIPIYEIYYRAGAFPAMQNMDSMPKNTDIRWELKYVESPTDENAPEFENGDGRPSSWNTDSPKVSDDIYYPITNKMLVENYKYYYVDSKEGALPDFKNYLVFYWLIEKGYKAQKKAYETLTKDAEFYRKAFVLNNASCKNKKSECGRKSVRIFNNYRLNTEELYIKKLKWWYKSESAGISDFLYDLSEESKNDFDKLFQLAYLDRSSLTKAKKLYTGIDIREVITPPTNAFKINLKKYNPTLHVRVGIQCTNGNNNCVWPNPTPKYQVRLFP